MDLAERIVALETKLAKLDERVITLEGQFDFISRQLRDLQMYVHAKFEQVDRRFDEMDARMDRMDGRLDRIEVTLKEMPRAIIEAIRENKLG